MTTEQQHDVLVLGGGVVGASAARALARGGPRESSTARRPLDVGLVDAYRPGHRHGSSYGDGRIVRLTYPEPTYLAMARAAIAGWQELEAELDTSLLYRTGSWECGPARSPMIAELADALTAAGIHFERWSSDTSRRHFAQIELPLGSEAIYQPDGAVIHADRAVAGLWHSAERAGASLYAGLRIDTLRVTERGVEAHGQRGDEPFVLRAARLVLAAGAWTGALVASLDLDLPLRVTREVVAYFPVSQRTANYADDHSVGGMPSIIDYHQPHPFYVLPQIEVPGLKVGWHRTGPEADPTVDAVPDAALLRRLTAFVGDRLPYLDMHPILTTTCLYTCTPDYHFILDHHPSWPHVVVAAGFSGHGFKFGPSLGELLADLAIGRASTLPLDLFRLDRFRHAEVVPRRSA